MLELRGLSKFFGGVRAVDGLDFSVREGEIVGLIGPNGSGKSTTVNLICGVFPVTAGSVAFRGRDITKAPPHQCLALGIARTFQNIRLFNELTVWQNLWVAQNSAKHRKERGFVGRWIGGRGQARRSVERYLEFSALAPKRDELAGNLSFGEQRRLAERIRRLKNQGKTVVLVEHVMELVMGVTERIAVLNFGRKIAEGTPGEIQANQAVREAYLGTGAKV